MLLFRCFHCFYKTFFPCSIFILFLFQLISVIIHMWLIPLLNYYVFWHFLRFHFLVCVFLNPISFYLLPSVNFSLTYRFIIPIIRYIHVTSLFFVLHQWLVHSLLLILHLAFYMWVAQFPIRSMANSIFVNLIHHFLCILQFRYYILELSCCKLVIVPPRIGLVPSFQCLLLKAPPRSVTL